MSKNKVFKLINSAFDGSLMEFKSMIKLGVDVSRVKYRLMTYLKLLLISYLLHIGCVKVKLCLNIEFKKTKVELVDEKIECVEYFTNSFFHSNCFIVMGQRGLRVKLKNSFLQIESIVDNFETMGSGWVIEKIKFVEIRLAKYIPIAGGSNIKSLLPNFIKSKKALIGFSSNNNKCFLHCCLAYFHYIDNKNCDLRRVNYSMFENKLDCNMLQYPVSVKSSKIKIFERKNNLSINIFSAAMVNDTWHVYPFRISKKKYLHEINLFIWENHYFYVKNIKRLLNIKNSGNRFFCYTCCQGFRKEITLKKHKKYCNPHKAVKIELPTLKRSVLEFSTFDYKKTMKCPYVAYFDFESILEPLSETKPTGSKSYNYNYQKHKVCSYAYVIIDADGKIVKSKLERIVDAAYHLITSLIKDCEEIFKKIITFPKKLTKNNEKAFKKATICYICKVIFNSDTGKVREHDHLIDGVKFGSNYRGAACCSCNSKLRMPNFLPCIAHSCRSYDMHFLIKTLNKIKLTEKQKDKIKVIPQNMEKFTTLMLDRLVFIDSYLFLQGSLSTLVSSNSSDIFKLMREQFPNQFDLLLRKGIFPYSFLDSFEKFDFDHLPDIEYFKNDLTNEPVSSEDYIHAQNVWDKLDCKKFSDYHDIYLMTDCLLLADIFENFRYFIMKNYGLEAAQFFTLPMLSWKAALKLTQVKIDLLMDYDQILFIERGIRGGISTASIRYAKANNKYLKNFDPNKPTSFIQYWDCNSLYSTAMCQPLPISNFKWLSKTEIKSLLFQDLSVDSPIGYILEVDLEYTNELHKKHNEYPLCPEQFDVKYEYLSDYQKQLLKEHFNISGDSYKSKKLIASLFNKKNYVIHYRMLDLCIKLGLKLVKIHKVLSFSQSRWLSVYINFNIDQRKQATNDFYKDLFKLLNNAVFGKTMENIRNRIEVKIITTEKQCLKLVKKPEVDSFYILDRDLAIFKMKKAILRMDKPMSIGFSILDISKYIMFDFYYNVLKEKYDKNIQLLYTDTDSFLMQIFTDDIFQDMKDMHNHLDCSDYPKDHFLFSEKNKKVNGKFKDESKSKQISEFIGLKSKLYHIKYEESSKSAAKGIKKNVIKSDLTYDMFYDTLFKNKSFNVSQRLITSKKHTLYSQEVNKNAMHAFDDKRFTLNDHIHTLAYGHSLLQNL